MPRGGSRRSRNLAIATEGSPWRTFLAQESVTVAGFGQIVHKTAGVPTQNLVEGCLGVTRRGSATLRAGLPA